MEKYFRLPKDFENFLYVSQILQAYGIKQAIEAHRRSKPHCWGSLYWQLDDCWPVASWSGMDYYKRWKALHYTAKKSYQPVIISILRNEDEAEIYVVSDLLVPFESTLDLAIIDFNGKEIFKTSSAVKISANSSGIVKRINLEKYLSNNNEDKILLKAELNGEFSAENTLYFTYPKYLSLEKPEIKISVEPLDEGFRITLNSDKLAKDVWLSTVEHGFFSDNYFDLLPNKNADVIFQTNETIEDLKDKIKITTLFDSY
jgi:beta-mannosidase